MNDIQEVKELKLVGRWKWLYFKRAFRKAFREDPELKNASFRKRIFLFRMIRKNAENYLCYLAGKKAGVLSLRLNRGTEAFIYAIAVKPKFRRKGLANFMMDFSEERAKRLKKDFVTLAVLWNNTPALELYKKYNFSALGEGHTFINIETSKIKQIRKYDLKLNRITNYNKNIRKSFETILLQGINEISGNSGMDYMKRNRTPSYHSQIKKNVDSGVNRLFQIKQDESIVGYFLERDSQDMKNISVFSKLETWNIDFIIDLSYKVKQNLIKSDKIVELNIRLPLHEVNRFENLEYNNFKRDRSSEKLILFKKI